MGSSQGRDIATAYDWVGSILPGVKTPGVFESSSKTQAVTRIRYAFCFVAAVNGSSLRVSWKVLRQISPFDKVRLVGTRTAAIVPVVSSVYWTRISYDHIGNAFPLPSPSSQFQTQAGLISSLVEWEVVGGTSLTCAFWEMDVHGENAVPSFTQQNSFGFGNWDPDSNGNDRMLADFATIPANSLYKPNGNGAVT